MKKYFPLFLATVLAAIVLASCAGSAPAPATKEFSLGEGQEVTFRSISPQTSAREVKVVFTIMGSDDAPVFYFQAFSDDKLMEADQLLTGFDLLQGIKLQGSILSQKLVIEYNPEFWEVKPSK